jgi:(2Fe-2S) ferredoxin
MTKATESYYRAHLFFCTNQRAAGHKLGCCASKQGEALRNYCKRRAKELGFTDIRVNSAGCLDRCAEGPVLVIYPAGRWYRPRSEADIDRILASLDMANNEDVRLDDIALPQTRLETLQPA